MVGRQPTTMGIASDRHNLLPVCYSDWVTSMKIKLTVRTALAIPPGDKDVIAWDTDVPGFGLKVTPSGRRTFFFYYRTSEGQQRRPAIGTLGAIKPEFAREVARRWRAETIMGGDPSKSRTLNRKAPTVRDLCNRYITEHAQPKKKASSLRQDRRLIATHLEPRLGSRKVANVTRSDVATLHQSLVSTPYEANRLLSLMGKMFKLAERWGLRPDGTNPATNIDRYPEQKRERFLSRLEIRRLWLLLESDAARKVASSEAISAIKLLMLTGRRLNEVLSLEWSWLDLDNRLMRLPDTKSGVLLVSLGGTATALLRKLRLERPGDKFVLPGRRSNRPMVNLQKPWQAIRTLAALEDVRLHDLRHTFASIGAGLGMSLPVIGRLLGHTQAATTSRYAHLAQEPVRQAADAIDAQLRKISELTSTGGNHAEFSLP